MIEGPGHKSPMDQIKLQVARKSSSATPPPFYVARPLVTDIAPRLTTTCTSAIGAAMTGWQMRARIALLTSTRRNTSACEARKDVKDGIQSRTRSAAHRPLTLQRLVPGTRARDDAISHARTPSTGTKQFALFARSGDRGARMHDGDARPDDLLQGAAFCSMLRPTVLQHELVEQGRQVQRKRCTA